MEYVKDGGAKSQVSAGTSIHGTMLRTNPEKVQTKLMTVAEASFDKLGQYINYYGKMYREERIRRGLPDLECTDGPPEVGWVEDD